MYAAAGAGEITQLFSKESVMTHSVNGVLLFVSFVVELQVEVQLATYIHRYRMIHSIRWVMILIFVWPYELS